MNISRLIFGVSLLGALPALAQPDAKIALPNGLPYPLVFPDVALKMVQKEKPISLHLHDVPLLDALAELEKQSQVKLDLFYGGYPDVLAQKLSIDLETRSYKEAFRAIIEESGAKAELLRIDSNNVLHVSFEEDPPDVPVAGDAPFQFRLQEVRTSLTKTLVAGKPPERSQDNTLFVNLRPDFDPRITIIKSGVPHVTRVEDDKGHSLAIDKRFGSSMDWGLRPTVNLYFKVPEGGSRSLSHLDGAVIYVVATKYEKWDMADVLTAKDASHDFVGQDRTLRATIKTVQQLGNQLQMEMEISTQALAQGVKEQDDSILEEQLMEAIHIRDANGQEFERDGSSAQMINDQMKMQMSFHLAPQMRSATIENGQVKARPAQLQPKITAPIAFTINAPVEFVQTEVPFSFSDLQLP